MVNRHGWRAPTSEPIDVLCYLYPTGTQWHCLRNWSPSLLKRAKKCSKVVQLQTLNCLECHYSIKSVLAPCSFPPLDRKQRSRETKCQISKLHLCQLIPTKIAFWNSALQQIMRNLKLFNCHLVLSPHAQPRLVSSARQEAIPQIKIVR